MQSFALVGLFAALFVSGVTAGPYKREDATEALPSGTFFSDTLLSAFPSGTGASYAVPTGGHHDGSAAILICRSVDPALYPGSPNNTNMSAIPSDTAPTSTPPTPTDSTSAPTDSQGSGGPIYICRHADSSAVPSGSLPSHAPSSSLPTGTGAPQSIPTDSQGSGGPVYLQCRPARAIASSAGSPSSPNDATLTPISSGPAPTSAPSTSTPDSYLRIGSPWGGNKVMQRALV